MVHGTLFFLSAELGTHRRRTSTGSPQANAYGDAPSSQFTEARGACCLEKGPSGRGGKAFQSQPYTYCC